MKKNTAQLLRETAEDQANAYLAVDEMLLFALERRYLGISKFNDINFDPGQWNEDGDPNLSLDDRLGKQVRLLQPTKYVMTKEIFHLQGGKRPFLHEGLWSLLFIVRSDSGARIHLGLVAFSESTEDRLARILKLSSHLGRDIFQA